MQRTDTTPTELQAGTVLVFLDRLAGREDDLAVWGELEDTLRPREAELRRALAERLRAELAGEV